MERDELLIIAILEQLVAQPFDPALPPIELDLPDYDTNTIQYHLLLLQDFDLIKAVQAEDGLLRPTRIMWKGHEHLAAQENAVVGGITSALSALVE